MMIAISGLLAGHHRMANDKFTQARHGTVVVFVLRQVQNSIVKSFFSQV